MSEFYDDVALCRFVYGEGGVANIHSSFMTGGEHKSYLYNTRRAKNKYIEYLETGRIMTDRERVLEVFSSES